MRLTIAYSKIKKRNLVLINNATYQRETLSERPIRQLSRRSSDMLILIELHNNNSIQLWHASSNMQIHKSTVYEGFSISLQPKVEADALYNCNLVPVQIYSIYEYTEGLKL